MEDLIREIENNVMEINANEQDPLWQTSILLKECVKLQQSIIKYENEERCRLCCYREEDMVSDYGFNCTCIYGCIYLTDIKETIGDIFISLVILSLQVNKISLTYKYKIINDFAFGITVKLIKYIGDLQMFIRTNASSSHFYLTMDNILNYLVNIANSYDLSLYECVDDKITCKPKGE